MSKRTSHAATPMNLLGSSIKELREGKGIAQAKMCRLLQLAGWDCDNATLNRIEKGKRTLTDVEIAYLLDILGEDWTVFTGTKLPGSRIVAKKR